MSRWVCATPPGGLRWPRRSSDDSAKLRVVLPERPALAAGPRGSRFGAANGFGATPPTILVSHATIVRACHQFAVPRPPCQDRDVRVTAGTWGGRTTEERRAERRQRLIDAATEIWSESGWAAVTMRGVCSRTSLNDRYFYEDFKDRDALLVAAWENARDEVLGEVSGVFVSNMHHPILETLRAAISAVVERTSRDPGHAQILLMHHAGSAALQDHRAAALQQATELVIVAAQPHLIPSADETGLRMDTLVAVGGFVELISAWQSGLLDVDAQHIVDHTSRLAATLSERYLRQDS